MEKAVVETGLLLPAERWHGGRLAAELSIFLLKLNVLAFFLLLFVLHKHT